VMALAATLAILVLLGSGYVIASRQLAERDSAIRRLNLAKNNLQTELDKLDKETKPLAALQEWKKLDKSVLTELDALARTFPDLKTHKLRTFTVSEVQARGGKKAIEIYFEGTYNADSDGQLVKFLVDLERNPRYHVVKSIKPASQDFWARVTLLPTPAVKSTKE